MIAVPLVLAELVIITGGIAAVLIVGPERKVGRHRLPRNHKKLDQEMVEIEAWLEAIRDAR